MSELETEFEKQRSEWRADNARLREEIGRLKLKNLTNAIGRICPDCGHDMSEDGCAHCLKAAINPLLELLHARIGDTSSGYYGSIKIDQPLIDTFEAAREKLIEKVEQERMERALVEICRNTKPTNTEKGKQ